ncbi:Phosphoglycolate phosphatase [Austwickia sp. TVS 96-490-7B]|uniref:HAD family hydrolase n=1 Tax=Austwickia sp. TVS 96-490-7B TaxID=2830843 RepID=UPI001C59EF4A|nr:HAD family hydrolase [Austwickia sp. TVS 96-490-7B]MBW3085381.1 Phosphoglycolate phosphatase [Austwickia sp. TVS 96-490-7B]
MNHIEPFTATAPLPTAVLWDLDGTLMDTEPLWFAQECQLVEEYGGTWTHDDALALVGNQLLVSARYIRGHSPVTLEEEHIVQRMQKGVVDALREHVPWRPGAVELLTELSAAGVPQALVTMSWKPVLEIVLTALPGDIFSAMVTGDSVIHGKPHPEPYLTGLSLLGIDHADAGSCVAVEDSESGSASAVAAGIPTLVTPCVKDVPAGPGLVLLSDLSEVRAADLHRLALQAGTTS